MATILEQVEAGLEAAEPSNTGSRFIEIEINGDRYKAIMSLNYGRSSHRKWFSTTYWKNGRRIAKNLLNI